MIRLLRRYLLTWMEIPRYQEWACLALCLVVIPLAPLIWGVYGITIACKRIREAL